MRKSTFKTIDDTQIYFETNIEEGDKNLENVIILNYGLVCSFHHWSKQIPFIKENNWKYVIHDYRGHFESEGSDKIESLTFKNFANDIYQLCHHLSIKKSVILGHSMGVNVSLQFAKDYPELCQSLILISGTVAPVRGVMLNNYVMEYFAPFFNNHKKKKPDLYKLLWKYSDKNPLVKLGLHRGGFNIKTVPMSFVETYVTKLKELGPDIFFQLLTQMNEHDIIAYLSNIEIPTLVVAGNRDKVLPGYLQISLAKEIRNSELYIVHDGSHVPQVDFPELMNQRLKVFIEKNHLVTE